MQIKNDISYDQTTPIEFEDKIKVWVDEDTNLMWEVKNEKSINETFLWEATKEWAEHLNAKKYGGFDDWEIPTKYQLESLLSATRNNGYYIKKPLSKNTKSRYWSSTPDPNSSFGAYDISFEFGYTRWLHKEQRYCVRCVRSI